MPSSPFYLGRIFDSQLGETTDEPLHYDPADLTTHAFVVGMTGSGKTGLCVDLLEEAALNNIPALMIDPKGDITNSLLHFPDLNPEDFKPWVNPDAARREGKSIEQAAADTANLWKRGLAQWGIDSERLRALKNAANYTVFTPGSDSGIPVSILATLKAPEIPWNENKEILREKISATATALLGLVGLTDIDPVRSREHILLANIFEHAWREGKDLDLGELIMQVQSPPFEKLGVLDVNRFFPDDDRFELSMLLNNILASPGFQSWIDGDPLDIQSLLYTPEGKPRHSVFYIAHLNDQERMFFVTLLFGAVETWMRSQAGSTSLRALLYFDEIFGYLPAGMFNPPSKEPMLRMLKQARAFGVGLVLVTQNPVDVDYKALSNAGTWFIGKLQTDRDKDRLLDGLQGASATVDRKVYDNMISALGKRVFLYHNVHAGEPKLFRTRWAMNYLAGPLTRTQIPDLNQLSGGTASTGMTGAPQVASPPQGGPPIPKPDPAHAAETEPERELPGTLTKPSPPSTLEEYYLPHNLTLTQAAKHARRTLPQDARQAGLLYRPVLLAQADVRFFKRKYNLDHAVMMTALHPEPGARGAARWGDYVIEAIEHRDMDRMAAPDARFVSLEEPFTEARLMSSLKKDFVDWVFRTLQVTVRANEALKVFAGPNVSQGDFRELVSEAAREKRDAEVDKSAAAYDRKLEALKTKLVREERELAGDKAEYQQRKMEEMGKHAENFLGLFSKRRSSLSSSLSKRRMTERAKTDVEESEAEIIRLTREIEKLTAEKANAIEDVREKWSRIANEVAEIPVQPYKKDVVVDMFGIAWMPYLLVEAGERMFELPGFGREQ